MTYISFLTTIYNEFDSEWKTEMKAPKKDLT